MIGSSRWDAVAEALRADSAADRVRVDALAAQLAALTARVEAGFERHAATADGWAKLDERVTRMEAALFTRLDAQSGITRTQAAALAALEEARTEDMEAVKRLRGDVARLGRQAASDVNEMRGTYAALAELVLAPLSNRRETDDAARPPVVPDRP